MKAALGDIATFVRGITFKPTDVNGDGVGVMRTKNVQMTLDLTDILRVPAHFVRREEQYLREGDVLVSSANSWYAVGKACWIPKLAEPLAVGGFVTALRPFSPRIEPRFLYHWFTSPRTQATLRALSNKTTNISNLNLKLALQMEVPVPPLDDQRRIAAILDQVVDLRARRSQALAQLDELIQSTFLDMFGGGDFPTVRASELMPNMRNGLSPATAGQCTATVLTLSAVTRGTFDPTAAKPGLFINDPPPDKRVSRLDFMMCRGNGNKSLVGVGTFSREDRPDLVFPDTIIAGRIDPSLVTMDFLEVAWRQGLVRSQIEALARTTNGTFKVNQQTLATVAVPVPSLIRQQEFAMKTARIETQRTATKKSLAQFDELFLSLQNETFRGEA